MKVLLIQPPYERIMGYSRFYTHQGLLSIAGVLKDAGHEVMVYDADYDPMGTSYDNLTRIDKHKVYEQEMKTFESDIWVEVADVIRAFDPELVGITVISSTVSSARKVSEIVKDIDDKITVFTGGVHASLAPNDLLEFSDYVIKNEGEYEVLKIIEGNVEEKIINGERITDLNKLPHPAYESLYGIENYKSRDLSLVMSTRGCPYGCKFCSSPLLWNRKITRKSVPKFIEELTLLKNNYNVSDFYIADDSFTYDAIWLEEFCNEIKKLNVTWRCLARVDNINERMIKKMYSAGCRNVKVGIESGSQRILNMVCKNITIDKVYEANKVLSKCNMEWSAYFIIGFPSETVEDIRMTQKLIKDIGANSITTSIYTPYPLNELYNETVDDYSKYGHYSNNNNFTGSIDDKVFEEIVTETMVLSSRNYIEHNCNTQGSIGSIA